MDPGFNQRWSAHPRPQATGGAMALFDKTGLTPANLRGKVVLDAGCGCGRFSAMALEAGARRVISVDSSPAALEATRENAPGAETIQADLLTFGLGEQQVDVAFSIGVLHHTASTKQAFERVAACVRPGGELAVWVYAKPPENYLIPAIDFLHEITRACPPDILHAACSKYSVKLRGIYGGRGGDLQQVLRISSSPDDDECISDTFDWHTPQYRWWHTEPEVRGWFEACGFRVAWQGHFPVGVRGVKR